MPLEKKVDNSFIYCNEPCYIGCDFHGNLHTLIRLLTKIIKENNLSVNFNLVTHVDSDIEIWRFKQRGGPQHALEHAFPNDNKVLNFFLQVEHNLVLEGGEGSGVLVDAKRGSIDSMSDDSKYFVRIVHGEIYEKFDGIIEYSVPNIENMRLSGYYANTLDKTVYVPPLQFEYNAGLMAEKSIDIATSFLSVTPRRASLLDDFKKNNFNYSNLHAFHPEELREALDNTKILVNIRQSDFHHTFEEFRVLPALQRGVVVISEDVPLRESIPYHEYIVWTSQYGIIDAVKRVSENYQSHFHSIHGQSSHIQNALVDMEAKAYRDLEALCLK